MENLKSRGKQQTRILDDIGISPGIPKAEAMKQLFVFVSRQSATNEAAQKSFHQNPTIWIVPQQISERGKQACMFYENKDEKRK